MAMPDKTTFDNFRKIGLSRLSLTEDKADDQAIDEELRAGVEMRGANLWVLMFAIFIASIGLNVNSTAVIIGAMLISPLMGPILGVGYGVGIFDFVLIRQSLKNLGIAAFIALLTSTAYFMLSPLTTADTELLARTTPTIWDVLIALFGGFAGIIGATRKGKSNVVPGVAIATALMPPLCTAGFGIARGDWIFFGGAFFLFTINCVFIALSSSIITRSLHIQQKKFVDDAVARRVHFYISVVVIATVLPSVYLAYQLVQNEVFKARSKEFVSQELQIAQTHIAETAIFADTRQIEVTLIGEYVAKAKLAEISARLPLRGLDGAKLVVHQVGDNRVDMTSLKAGLLKDLYTQSQLDLEKKDKIIEQLQASTALLAKNKDRFRAIPPELHALYPTIENIVLSEALDWSEGTGADGHYSVVVNASTSRPLASVDTAKIVDWLRIRTQTPSVKVFIQQETRASQKRR